MSIASMTGFARSSGTHGAYSWAWEAKSVNNRGIDIRCRLPVGFDALESAARKAVAGRFKRGAITIGLQLKRLDGRARLRVNRQVLAELLEAVRELGDGIDAARPRLDGLLALPGVVETVEDEDDEAADAARDGALLAGLDVTLDRLGSARAEEGARIAPALQGLLDEVASLSERAGACAATQPETLERRLEEQVAALIGASPALPQERLVQEAALLAAKADVREELDRLVAHHAAARALLGEAGPIGRRFDFLCQEFNREANTLCAKSADVALTDIGLALKAAIEQLREQVQNIE
ncbi:MAG: YicC/YloC family endoribonuclease [Alphaproteobacteria bacterium]|nr:YicC/YloC family endoribonuclease [Alphaproteobacteria bacterium]MDP6517454.1 YicC/YloC family endoribonuclease [Alphaproteobacteria bacterium]